MKKILIFVFLIMSLQSFGQNPANYTKISARYRWISGMFDSAFYVPRYNGLPSGVRVNETSAIDGMIAMDTTNSRLYIYSGGVWIRLANFSEIGSTPTWQQTLTAGSTLTGNNTVDGGGFDFKLYSAAGNILFNTKANSTSYGSRLYLNGDSAWYVGNNRAYVKSSGVGNKLHIVAGQTSSDTTTYKPLAAQSSDGETVLMTYWPGGGGSGTVTNFSATDGNGFDFTVTNPTTTPTLTATTDVANTRVMFSNSGAITGSPRMTYNDDVNYPTLTIDGTYEGYVYLSTAVGSDNFRISGANGGTLYGSDTYRSVGINDYIYGGQVARFYSSGSVKYIDLAGSTMFTSTDVLSLTRGPVDITRTVPYALTGNNHHGFTDETNFRLGNAAFNSVGSFVHFGNNTTNQDHYAFSQNVATKDSSNTMGKVYGFVNAVGQVTGGTITDWYGYYHYDQDTAGGTIGTQYGVYIPALTAAGTNYGVISLTNNGFGTASPTAKLHLGAGSATANTAPLKLTTGTNLTSAEVGAIEYATPQLTFTNGGGIRQELFQGNQNFVQTQFDKTSNTTLGDVTNLSVSVAAGKAYRFEAILYTSSNVAGGVKAAISGTATATTIIYEGLTTDAGTTTQSRATSLGTAVGAVTAVTAAYIKITGTIIVNAAGTLTVQFAQNASNGSASSVLVGSTFHVIELAYFP